MRPRLLTLAAAFFAAAPARARPPSDLEQYYLELINRARADPASEVARLADAAWEGGPDLDEGLPPATIAPGPRPPLAFEPRLCDAALMNSFREAAGVLPIFTNSGGAPMRHLPEGIPILQEEVAPTLHLRLQAENYFPPSAAEFAEQFARIEIARERIWVPFTPIQFIFREDVDSLHAEFFIDAPSADRARRRRLLDPKWVAIGLHFARDAIGIRAPVGFSNVAFASTQTFVADRNFAGVTGVVYHDSNGNAFYDLGESAGSLDMIVTRPNGVFVARARSFPSGGYTIPLPGAPPGSYLLRVVDAYGASDSKPFFWNGQENVKVDFISPPLIAPFAKDPPYRIETRAGFSDRTTRSAPAGFLFLRRDIRTLRAFSAQASFTNHGHSKYRAALLSDALGRSIYQSTSTFHARGTKTSSSHPLSAARSVTVQSGETVRATLRIRPRRPSRAGLGRSFRRGLLRRISLSEGFPSRRAMVIFELKDKLDR